MVERMVQAWKASYRGNQQVFFRTASIQEHLYVLQTPEGKTIIQLKPNGNMEWLVEFTHNQIKIPSAVGHAIQFHLKWEHSEQHQLQQILHKQILSVDQICLSILWLCSQYHRTENAVGLLQVCMHSQPDSYFRNQFDELTLRWSFWDLNDMENYA